MRARVFFLFTAFLLLSCASLTRALSSGDQGDPAARYGVSRETSIYLAGGQPETLDPATTLSGASGPVGHIFSGLVRLDTNLQVQPDLAAGWEVSPDGTVYTFYLHRRAVFHDGRPVTAADVVFSWERAANPVTGSDTILTYLGDVVGVPEMATGQADHISGLRAIDDYTLEVRIDAPKVYFLAKLTYPVSFVVDRHNVGQPDWEHRPNGAGPFTLQVWEDDEILVLARNERYYLGPPAVAHVVYLMGAGIPLSMYETGQIDLVGVDGSTLERVQNPNDPLFPNLRTGVDMCTTFIGFNNRLPPFDNPLVRQAFSQALDKERLISGLFLGDALPAVGPLPPGMPGFTGGEDHYPFNPERARELLAQAGYTPESLPPLTYTTAGYGSVGSLVTAVITMWQENLGVTIEPVLLEPYQYYDELFADNIGHFFGHGWCADYPDPENFLDVLFHGRSLQNLGGYSNPAVDALLEQARVEADVTTRLALYAGIEQMIVADAPAVFLNHSLAAVLVKPALQNYILTPIGVPQWQQVTISR
ncbi:MAG: peptide ABC transporter substrate-binding protein [Chloroflexi bacterium]|nr:peptide ABC transporter substrate-binding protein [Chloroflexota bacterium]MCI0577285.1 peptide ABC transporter substrate-binding protein [Chloroflexota bacterium]MCI0647729.1 peptide ABC transporter substrate-binding protein [Chloroflexota bacterium]MCI0731593.1 peptide ABC transporter substrate-binding protein [Chloroflexota bacterium]